MKSLGKRQPLLFSWWAGRRLHRFISSTVFSALAGIILAAATSANAQEALTSIKSVRGLTSAQAAQRNLVDIEATVTYPMLPSGFFIYDQNEGIYVDVPQLTQSNLVLHAGDRVRLKAVTDPGEYFPRLVCQALTLEGGAELPKATLVTPENLFSPNWIANG